MNTKILLRQRPSGRVSPDNFTVVKEKREPIQNGEFVVQNEYLSLEPAMKGWMTEMKSYIPPVKLGEVMRGVTIGTVLDSKSSKFQVGDRVTGLLGWQSFTHVRDESHAKALGITKIVSIPGIRDTAYLGVLGSSGLTAYFGLLDIGQPKAGETLLVSGAAGAVGSAVGQIEKIKGCYVVGIAGSDDKCAELVSKFGFDAAINYKTTKNLRAEFKEKCPKGIDIYFDNVGGAILDIALSQLNKFSRVVLCGGISQYDKLGSGSTIEGPKNYLNMITARTKMQGFIVTDYVKRWHEAIAEMAGWINEGKLKYSEHIVEGLENTPKALEMLFTGANNGKLIVSFDSKNKSKL